MNNTVNDKIMDGASSSEGKGLMRAKSFLWILLFLIYPFFIGKDYSDVSKGHVIFFAVSFMAMGALISGIYLRDNKDKKELIGNGADYRPYLLFATFFIILNLISALLSDHKEVVLFGRTDSYIGFFWYLLMVLFYLFLTKFLKVDRGLFVILSVAAILIIIVSWIQFFGVDLLNLFKSVNQETLQNYLSPFGNIGVFGQFIILMIGPSAILCMEKDDYRYRVLGMVTAAFVACGMIMSNTDATYLGCFFAIILILACLLRDNYMMAGFTEMITGFLIGGSIFTRLYIIKLKKRALSALSLFVISHMDYNTILLALLLFLIALIFRRVDKKYPMSEKERTRRRILSLVLFIAIIIFILSILAVFFHFSFIDRTKDLGVLEKYLRFNEHWGTDRGYIWMYIWTELKNSSVVNWLFGHGQGSLEIDLVNNHLNELKYEAGFIPKSAHNLYLHMLYTLGILGAGTLFAAIFYTIIRAFVRTGKNREAEYFHKTVVFGIVSVLLGFLVQSSVSMTVPDLMPYIVLYLAILTV